MIERDDTADDAQGFAHREVHHIGAHRDRRALHLGDEAGEELHLRRRDHSVAHHFAHRIAAVGSVDHGKFIGVLPQNVGDPPQDLGALEWQHPAPFLERGLGGGHRRVDVVSAGVRHLAEREAGTGVHRFDEAPRFRLMPGAAVIGAAVLRQYDCRNSRRWRDHG